MTNALLESFALILLAELGDKTQIAMMLMASNFSKLRVFLGGFTSLLTMSIISILLGNLISIYLPLNLVKLIAGCAFIILALFMILSKKEEKKSCSRISKCVEPFCVAYLVTFLAELGDKTQLTLIVLALTTGLPLQVFIGSAIAFGLINGIGVFLGDKLLRKLPERVLKIVTSVMFLIFGVLALIEGLSVINF